MKIKKLGNNRDYIPADHSKQVSLEYYTEKILDISGRKKSLKVLDLGCGQGNSFKYFTSLNPKIEWIGLDIEISPEVMSRTENNERFVTFNGIDIPFNEGHFDLVYCCQVLEHVKYPRELLSEVRRVMKTGGYFLGSTSHLEPFHSFSFWNFTPYGFSILIEEAKLKLVELRPSIDSLTLIIRRGLGCPKIFNVFWKIQSPLNLLISLIGEVLRLSHSNLNTIKLLFCGQFIFFVQKPNHDQSA